MVPQKSYLPFVEQALISGGTFLSTLIIGRYLDTTAMVIYVLVGQGLTLLGGISRATVHTLFTIRCGRKPQLTSRMYSAFSRANAALIPGYALVFMLTALAVDQFTFTVAIAGAGYAWTYGALELRRRRLHQEGKLIGALAQAASWLAVQTGSILAIAWMGKGLALLFVVLSLFGLALLLADSVQWQPLRSRTPIAAFTLRLSFKVGSWDATAHVIYWFSTQFWVFLLTRTSGTDQAAEFAAATAVLNALNILRLTLANIQPTKISVILGQGNLEELRRDLTIYTKRVLALAAVGLCLVYIGANVIVRTIYGPDKFPEASKLMLPLLFGHIAAFIQIYVSNVLSICGRGRYNFFAQLTGATIMALVGIPMALVSGAFGAALGTIAVASCTLLVSAVGLRRALSSFTGLRT